MDGYLLAITVAMLGWWFSTGLILILNHLPRHTHRWSFAAATVLLLASLALLPTVSAQATSAGAVAGFLLALLIWGWLEMGYLMGFVTGPLNAPCPTNASTRQRFFLAIATSLYHELSVLALAGLVMVLSWEAPNQVATLTIITLWLMRWSAKLNLFLGVRNYNGDWLPEHLRYLDSYTRRRSLNPLLPLSLAIGAYLTWHLFLGALGGTTGYEVVANTLVGTLMALAVLEHACLALPLREALLWQWALPNDRDGEPARTLASSEKAGAGPGDAEVITPTRM